VPIYVRAHDTTPQKSDSDDATPVERQDSDDLQSLNAGDELNESEASDPQTETEFSASENLGIRQRLRFRSRDSDIPDEVPSRPAASSPQESPLASPFQQQQQQQQQAISPPPPYRNNTNPVWRTPLSPTVHPASLSQGLLRSFQQQTQQQSAVPPLHRGIHRMNNETDWEVQPPDATEYLSRLLIMLGSFVMLCLLLL
jgi:hypothetical protein